MKKGVFIKHRLYPILLGDQLDKLCFFGIPPHCKTPIGIIDCVIKFLLTDAHDSTCILYSLCFMIGKIKY